jgi:Rad3-related DNA helicase
MKYKHLIDRAYGELSLIPRAGQIEAVHQVLQKFFDEGYKNVVLSADTGTGKSIIGAVVAMCFQQKFDLETAAFILMQNNNLVNQYADTFGNYEAKQFYQVKGAVNYPCAAETALTGNKFANAESCIEKKHSELVQEKFCNGCEFKKAKRLRNVTSILISNYSYYFVSRLYAGFLNDRKLTIFDEAHTLNDVFCDNNAIHFNVDMANKIITDIKENLDTSLEETVKTVEAFRDDMVSGKLTVDNYIERLTELRKAYKTILGELGVLLDESDDGTAVKYTKLYKKYIGYFTKINDLLVHNYDHVFEFNKEALAISVKPIFIGKMSKILLGEYNLFMSATISDTYIKETLELDSVGFVKLPPVFAKENKKISFIGNEYLNFTKMNDPKVITDLAKKCSLIVDSHSEDGESGLILVPSFKLAVEMATQMETQTKVFLHKSGVKLNDLIAEFKKCKEPAVLISPSIYEGLDFAGDHSRYQILLKAPYPSLGEKRIKYIAESYPDIYKLMTITKIVQGIGRSIRSPDDYAMTYSLDKAIKGLYDSPLNVWKDQFEVV